MHKQVEKGGCMDLIVLNGVAFGAIGAVLAMLIFGDGSVQVSDWGVVGFVVGVVFMAVAKITEKKKVKK